MTARAHSYSMVASPVEGLRTLFVDYGRPGSLSVGCLVWRERFRYVCRSHVAISHNTTEIISTEMYVDQHSHSFMWEQMIVAISNSNDLIAHHMGRCNAVHTPSLNGLEDCSLCLIALSFACNARQSCYIVEATVVQYSMVKQR